jgi:hypothetical protein
MTRRWSRRLTSAAARRFAGEAGRASRSAPAGSDAAADPEAPPPAALLDAALPAELPVPLLGRGEDCGFAVPAELGAAAGGAAPETLGA